MVWNQYVYEAMNGNDAENSDYDEEINIDEPLHINDWELEHQDELRYMWGYYNSTYTMLLYHIVF
jgi:hypothetical protein